MLAFTNIVILLFLVSGFSLITYMLGKTRGGLPAIIFQLISAIAYLVIIIGAIFYFLNQNRHPELHFEERFQQIEKDIFELRSYHQQN